MYIYIANSRVSLLSENDKQYSPLSLFIARNFERRHLIRSSNAINDPKVCISRIEILEDLGFLEERIKEVEEFLGIIENFVSFHLNGPNF